MNKVWFLLSLTPCLLFAQTTNQPATDRAIRVKSPKSADVYSEQRVALVIGNGAYGTARLVNPPNDAEDIAKALQVRKFTVTCVVNADKRGMKTAIEQFGRQLTQGGIGLFYYAGHGAQREGKNYLFPVAVEIQTAQDVEDETVSVSQVLSVMEAAGNRLNIIILDACRNNPYPAASRDGVLGLAAMKAPAGTLIAFATAEGKTAAEGKGRNGVYTKHLLDQMAKPGLKAEEMFKAVRVGVKTETTDQQVPFDYSSLTGDFYFTPIDFDDGRMALTQAELKRLRQLEDEQRKADAEKTRVETEAKAKQDALDQEVARLKAQLKVQGTTGTLDTLVVLAKQREQLDNQLRDAKRKAADEKLKRDMEIYSLKKQERANRKVAFAETYTKYQEVTGSKFLTDEEKANAWKAICGEWQVVTVETKPGELTWDDGKGCVIVCVKGLAAKGTLTKTVQGGIQTQTFDPDAYLAKELADKTLDLGGGVKIELVWVPAGEFDMGSNEYDNEKPVHRVKLTRGFWMGKYEVTQEQWEQVMKSNPSHFKETRNPVENVGWNDCQEFLKRLNEIVRDRGFRLPTEAEWEYACRAGTKTKFYSSDSESVLTETGWSNVNSGKKPHLVGKKKVNAFGLYDMHGNVWEWCQDWDGAYPSETVSDPTGPLSGSNRVVRGGSWYYIPKHCSSATRCGVDPASSGGDHGFRVVCVR